MSPPLPSGAPPGVPVGAIDDRVQLRPGVAFVQRLGALTWGEIVVGGRPRLLSHVRRGSCARRGLLTYRAGIPSPFQACRHHVSALWWCVGSVGCVWCGAVVPAVKPSKSIRVRAHCPSTAGTVADEDIDKLEAGTIHEARTRAAGPTLRRRVPIGATPFAAGPAAMSEACRTGSGCTCCRHLGPMSSRLHDVALVCTMCTDSRATWRSCVAFCQVLQHWHVGEPATKAALDEKKALIVSADEIEAALKPCDIPSAAFSLVVAVAAATKRYDVMRTHVHTHAPTQAPTPMPRGVCVCVCACLCLCLCWLAQPVTCNPPLACTPRSSSCNMLPDEPCMGCVELCTFCVAVPRRAVHHEPSVTPTPHTHTHTHFRSPSCVAFAVRLRPNQARPCVAVVVPIPAATHPHVRQGVPPSCSRRRCGREPAHDPCCWSGRCPAAHGGGRVSPVCAVRRSRAGHQGCAGGS